MNEKPTFRKPVPEGVIEHTGLGSGSSSAVVQRADGSLLTIAGNRTCTSVDCGSTWEPSAEIALCSVSTGIRT